MLTIRPHSKLNNFAYSSRNESFENRSLPVVKEDSKKINNEEIKQKYQVRLKSIKCLALLLNIQFETFTPKMSNFEELMHSWALFNSKLLKIFLLSQDYKVSNCTIKYEKYLINDYLESIKNLLLQRKKSPKIHSIYLTYIQKYFNLLEKTFDITSGKSAPCSNDKRFRDKLWCENPFFHFVSESYLLLNEFACNLIRLLSENNPALQEKLLFYTQQHLNALAPSNFFLTNPSVIQKAIETHGENFLQGLNNFIEDLERSEGKLQISMTNFSAFQIGKNIAATPGEVVYQNDLIQLIQYKSSTKKVYRRPFLFIPPWINKYYILDLSKENSLVRWLINQGYTVFMISWVNPDKRHSHKNFEDYMQEGPLAALDIIQKITDESMVNAAGYCIGGTLLACTLAYLTKKKQKRIASATYFATLLDFSQPGTLGVFLDEAQVNYLDEYLACKGYLDGYLLFQTFNLLRSNDLIWSFFVRNYLNGDKPPPMDILYWNADYTNLPRAMSTFYLRNMYLNNKLIQPNAIQLNHTSINLLSIKTPSYFISAQQDHITPWESSYSALSSYGGTSTFVLTGSGHVAGIVNPPANKKYFYYIHENEISHTTSIEPKEFLQNAKKIDGSWWPHWEQWLRHYSGKLISARIIENSIEKAPGTYVKQ